MKTTHELLENQITRLSRILADRYDVKVIFQGHDCRTDGRTIYLPALPDTLEGPEAERLLALMEGLIDHEVGHILFSDFGTLKKVTDPVTKMFLGVVEDIREEAFMGRLWRGSKGNLDRSNQITLNDDIYPNWDKLEPLFKLCMALEVLASDDPEQIDSFPQPELLDELKPLKGAVDMITSLPSSNHSLAMAKYMMDVLGFEFNAPIEEIDGLPEAIKELMEELSTGCGGGMGSHTLIRTTGGSGAEDSDDDSDDSEPLKPGELKGALDSFGVDPETAHEAAEDVEELRSRSSKIEDEVAGLRKHYDTRGVTFYAPYTTKHDKIEVIKANARAKEAFVDARSSVRESTGVLTRKLRMSMASIRKIQIQRGQEWGALSPSRLARFLVSDDSRVFERKGFKQDVFAYVSLLVDLSGSMHGKKIREARKAVIAFGEFLNAVRIPFEILGFTTAGFSSKEYQNADDALRRQFTRWDKLKIEVYKEFHEQWKKTGPRVMNMEAHCHNVDGESVLIAAQRLQRAAPVGARRILFVFSDGYPEYLNYRTQPNAQAHLKRVVRRCMDNGIELIGIGICSDSVAEYYPDHIVVNNASDLAAAELQKLKEYLIQGRRQSTRRAAG